MSPTLPDLAFLHHLLDLSADLGPEYGGQLATHLPMALAALHGLGAGPARLQAFFDGQRALFGPPTPRLAPRPMADWTQSLGHIEAYAAFRAHFDDAIHRHGRDRALRAALPALMPGVAAAAFHGLIRTAHAVDVGHDGELACGLAYWAARWQRVRAPGAAQPALADWPFDAWLDRVRTEWQTHPQSGRVPGGLISQRLAHVVHRPSVQAWCGRLQVDGRTLDRLLAWSARRFAECGHFTVLHQVTGAHAARVLQPWLDDAPQALGHLADAWAAALVTTDPRAERDARANAPTGAEAQDASDAAARGVRDPWTTLTARAVASDDEHVIKLVHACRAEARRAQAARGGPGQGTAMDFQRAAWRAATTT